LYRATAEIYRATAAINHIVDPGYDRHEDASSRLLNYYESALEEASESRSSTK